ncbi:MAG TPA: VOC family protein [Candidatus Binataceae bacterium]|nr:VOC family protein [Candidatus Binataceae bacterium]
MIKIRVFSHSALRVSDAERAKAFYEKVLGLKKLDTRPDFKFGGAWYSVGTNQIHIIESEKREGVINPMGPHVALEVEDFEETKRTLKEMGIEFLEAPTNMAGRQLWILDPDGNTVELRVEK